MKAQEIKLLSKLTSIFEEKYGDNGRLFFSPSRINIIGEHIDYNGGKVLPCAIEIGTYGMAKANDLGLLRLYSVNTNSGAEISIDNLDFDEKCGWMNYVTGMFKELKKIKSDLQGIDVVVYGNIPTGSGLSSSASLEMLIGEILNTIFDLNISREDMSVIGMKVENNHLGLQTGIMDQFAISLGKENSAILLDTSTLDYEYINIDLQDNILVILNTNKPRSLVVSKYNERRAETQKGLDILKEYVDIDNLAQLDVNPNFEELIEKIDSDVINRRVRHVVEENRRVKDMVVAIENKDYEKMGLILNSSHESLKNYYEVTGLELDSIVEGARKSKYTLGARMTGAGFSGCAIALVKKEGLEDLEKNVKEYYKNQTGLEADIIISEIVGGPREIK